MQDKLVTLTIVTETNHVPFIGIEEQMAVDMMTVWVNHKNRAGSDEVMLFGNFNPPSAVLIRAIIGMYVTKFDSDTENKNAAWNKMQHEMMRIQVETARLQLRKLQQEDSWKDGDQE